MGKKIFTGIFFLVMTGIIYQDSAAEYIMLAQAEQMLEPEVSLSMEQAKEERISEGQEEEERISGDQTKEYIPIGQTTEENIPIGQTEEQVSTGKSGITADIFGKKRGFFHPVLLIETRYTDNLYNTNDDKKDDYILSMAPALWIALPANREKLIELGTTTTAPGGLKLSRIKPETTRRSQTYLLYSPEFLFYSRQSEHNDTNHKAEGLFQYNFNMGLSVDVLDQFNKRSQANYNGISETLDLYKDNLFNILLIYEPSQKFKFRVDYSNYFLNYEDKTNYYMNRIDNSFSVYGFYRIRPKTSIFVEYEFSDISFDDPNMLSDSIEDRYYTGLQWDVTAKTKGQLKLGYIQKDFDYSNAEDQSGLSYEIQAQHNFTPKRALQLNASRRFNESNAYNSNTFLTNALTAAWLQRFYEKWSGTVNFSFTRDKYNNKETDDGILAYEIDEREDDTFSIAPALRYEFRKWLIFDLGYIYTERNSNFNDFDFENNTIFFRADFSM